jgi:alkylation response protein AidB-like acyl-CoA dehydrogenase
LTWPKKYGGHEEPLWKQIILEEETTYRGAPGLDPYQFVGGMGDLLLEFGTEAQRQKYLPMMVRGEIKGATGMSEPNAGSDLANLQLRAELQGDYFVLNGQKTWQSAAHRADLEPVYVRTDPDMSKKHRGISIILVEMKKKLKSLGMKSTDVQIFTPTPGTLRQPCITRNATFPSNPSRRPMDRIYDGCEDLVQLRSE